MWQKKTKEKIQNELFLKKEAKKKKFASTILKTGMWTFIGIFFLRLIEALTIGLNYRSHQLGIQKTIDWNEIPKYYTDFLVQALICSVIIMILRIYFSSEEDQSSTLMCEKCHQSRNYTQNEMCSCGGKLYPIGEFEWLEEENKEVKITSK